MKNPILNTSTLISAVFHPDKLSNEPHASLGIDPQAFTNAPAGEAFRIDIDTLNDIPLGFVRTLKFLRKLNELFPAFRQAIGVFTNREEGRIVFLPNQRNADSANVIVINGDQVFLTDKSILGKLNEEQNKVESTKDRIS